MRDKTSFGQRTSPCETKEGNRRFFLVYEGADTESIYFNYLDQNRQKCKINPLISIIELDKGRFCKDVSNPKKILDDIVKLIDGAPSYSSLANTIIDCLLDSYSGDIYVDSLTDRSILQLMVDHFKVNEADTVSNVEETSRYVINCLRKNLAGLAIEFKRSNQVY